MTRGGVNDGAEARPEKNRIIFAASERPVEPALVEVDVERLHAIRREVLSLGERGARRCAVCPQELLPARSLPFAFFRDAPLFSAGRARSSR